ncbi:MAG: B12-binding domain-containing radical SAM protein [Lachnospiraceae bacterium]|nr:B12-binding domain-containing radical SAM protein [Lachnospiraceae bacterium]MDD6169706.1 B12-binding domain-containing radical SAM protein [Lachnospiraceae bacterium]MDY4840115.1 B12-binding domain-containing radical SAM protein [Lachnospiraceae bacterium]
MKILLTAINAKYIHSNLAIYSLRAYAKEYKDQIALAEFTINQRTEYILSEIFKKKPDVLCFSCYIWNIRFVLEVAEEFHKICPKVPIWVGGPEVSYEVEDFLKKNRFITGVMVGEGEKIFRHVCDCYVNQDGHGLENIKGLAFLDADGHMVCKEPEMPMDLSEIPFCYDDMEDFKNKIIYYESSRGCPFRCSYCLSSIDKALRFRNLELVKKELAFFLEKEVPQVKFVDRTFNCDHRHAMEIWRFIKENDRGITNFHFEIAADLLTDEEIAFLGTLRPGLVQLEIGVQTTNPKTIHEIHRRMDLERLKHVVQQIKAKENIHEHLDLIAGLPFEDYETFQKSFDEIYALKPEQLQLGFLKVLKGSYMFEHKEEYQVIYESNPPYEVLETKWLPYEKVLRIKLAEEMLEVYYNSRQYPMSIKLLETEFDSAYVMFESLGKYYEEKGYAGLNHTRIGRLQILLEFVETIDAEHLELFKQAATYDIYSRENAKSRPMFASDLNEFKELTRKFCKKGKLTHLEKFDYRMPEEETVAELPGKQKEPYYLLFDYEKKDALNHRAMVCEIDTKA